MSGMGARGAGLLRWMVAFTVLCIITLCLRAWAARIMRRRFFLDDLFIIISFAATISFQGVAVWAILNGSGRPQAELEPHQLATLGLILVLPSSITWLTATVCVKFSVLLMYTRIFSTQPFRRWSYSLMAVVACYFVAFMALFMTICDPIDHLWNPNPDGTGRCRDTSIQEFTSVSFNLVVDLVILILPLPWLWGLQMPLRNKIAVSIMFCIGFATVGIMVWRLAATKHAMENPDLSYWQTDIAFISLLELWFGLIVACIPTLAPLGKTYVKPMVSKIRSFSYGSSRHHSAKKISLDHLSGSASTSQTTARTNRRYQVMGDDDHGHPLVLTETPSMPGMAITTDIPSFPLKDNPSYSPHSSKTTIMQHDVKHESPGYF